MQRAVAIAVLVLMFAAPSARAAWVARPGTVKVLVKKRLVSATGRPLPRSVPVGLVRQLGAELVDEQDAFLVLQTSLPNASAAPTILRDLADLVEGRDDLDILHFLSSPIDARLPAPRYPPLWERRAALLPPARDAFVVQFATVPRDSWIQEIQAAGATILQNVPSNGYVVLGRHDALDGLAERLPIQLLRVHQPIHKVSPAARAALPGLAELEVLIADVPEAADALAYLAPRVTMNIRPPESAGDRAVHRVRLDAATIPQLAAHPAVLWIDLHIPASPSGQREAHLTIGDTFVTTAPFSHPYVQQLDPLRPVLGNHRDWIFAKGLSEYPAQVGRMAILDTGFDTAFAGGSSDVHPDFKKSLDGNSSFVTVRKYTSGQDPGPNSDCSGHGTFVAGVLAGNAGATHSTMTRDDGADGQYLMGLGIVPEMPLLVGRIFDHRFQVGTGDSLRLPLTTIFSDLITEQVSITSNSWNKAAEPTYDIDAFVLDKLVRSATGQVGGPPMPTYFSAGNSDDGGGQPLVSRPATAKNVITVGASENFNMSSYNPLVPGGVGGEYANNGKHIWTASQGGTTSPDSRIKPDIVAPGTAIESAASRDPRLGDLSPGGCSQNPVGAEIDSTPGRRHFWSRGSSFSAPLAAGAGALLYTWFKTTTGAAPKPSLLKAMQITFARDLSLPQDSGDFHRPGRAPDTRQGWGKTDLTGAFFTQRYAWNNEQGTVLVPAATSFLPAPGSGYRVRDTTKPVRLTVAWTDAPGDPAVQNQRQLMNDLDLTVRFLGTGAGKKALGNFFDVSSGRSVILIDGVPGGTADIRNNVEQAAFTASEAGSSRFQVQVFGKDIRMDGINVWSPGSPQQDFSLFIDNAEAYVNNAIVLQEMVPASVEAGGNFVASLTLRNTGDKIWSEADRYRLGSIAPPHPFGTRVTLGSQTVSPNGGEHTFVLTTTAPYAKGFYPFRWQMVEEPISFGAATENRMIEVTPRGYSFYTVTPCRALDTRQTGMGGKLVAGVQRDFLMRGTCGIPATAVALSANLTVVGTEGLGYVLVYPPNMVPPPTSSVNFSAGQTRANNALLTLDTAGQIAAVASGSSTDLLLDVTGYFQ